jgi:hypothetical protein
MTRDDYGKKYSEKTRQLQDWLQMPLNTENEKRLNLPDYRVSNAQPSPYVQIYGIVKTNKKLETIISISIGKKPNTIEYSLNTSTGIIEKNNKSKIKLKIDNQNYFLGNENLFAAYVASGLLEKDSTLNNDAFDLIATKFLEYTKKQSRNISKSGNIPFFIYVLPDKSEIEFKAKIEKISGGDSFIDYFGNSASSYASTPTKTAKFLSYDDKAFSINCKREREFYKNLGIGNTSLDKIYRPTDKTFNISGLEWTFTDISGVHPEFKDTRKGILMQLYENYYILSKDAGTSQRVHLKVICTRINQAKQELLIDENLTMQKMKSIFLKITETKIPPLVFEILIDKTGKNPIWSTYLYAIRNFLSETKIPKEYLLEFFSKILKHNRYDWVKLKNNLDANDFFIRSDFCIKCLTTSNMDEEYMNTNEEFAYKIGQIARRYVDFKQNNKDSDNSLGDILTYSKYDRERLRFIVSRIGKGIQLAKVAESSKNDLTKKISTLQPKEEISDDEAPKDYSYFFFKGYYTNQEILT